MDDEYFEEDLIVLAAVVGGDADDARRQLHRLVDLDVVAAAAAVGRSLGALRAPRFAGHEVTLRGTSDECGRIPAQCALCGGSDGNVIAALGTPTVVLATGMTKVHTTDEELAVADLERLGVHAVLVDVIDAQGLERSSA